MKALTIKQPWASLLMAGVKRVENRTWSTGHRGRLAIHAGKQVDPAAAAILAAAGIDPEPFADAPRGAILGTVELVDVIDGGDPQRDFTRYDVDADPLAFGPYCWVLEDPRPLDQPIPCRGALSLWEVDLEEMIR